MRIITYNVNGIRAAMSKGFIDWLKSDPADVICIQETKAGKDNVNHKLITELGYHDYWYPAAKKGYSGVAVFTKIQPDHVTYGCNEACGDDEGRILQLDFRDIRLINAYFPSGTTGEERQGFKYKWLNEFLIYLNKLRIKHPNIILCGDYNIAHREIDIHDPKGNKKSSGFLPEERAWLDSFFATDFVDTLRHFHTEPNLYTWWTQRFPWIREQNKGWRIDYINVTGSLQSRLMDATILPDVKHSDHCPVFLEINHN
ncbi:MAG TPA: exodeoxyribonuclease III [Flavitalea sp.]|nr:exodeoxyribonuclease III [Flavitalea sp.]